MESNVIDVPQIATATGPSVPAPQLIELHGYCYSDRVALLPRLTSVFTNCGGWVLERRTISPAAMEFRFEIQLIGVVDLYGALVGLGLELTRSAHAQLTELCIRRKHIASSPESCPVLTLRLEINFLEDVTLHSILMTGSGLA